MSSPETQAAGVDWRDGAPPWSRRFQDVYFSPEDGLAESRHVFLAGNGLPGRFRPGFHMAELGFGSGLNALAAAQSWQAAGLPGALAFTSFEAEPMEPEDMARALAAFPELADLARPLAAAWAEGARRIDLPGLALTVIEGDARLTLPAWRGRADAWALDGFAPDRNPQMWEPALLAAVFARTAPGGTCATYSAAGLVRAGLTQAGFAVARHLCFGRKRHMTRGIRP